MFLRLLTSGIAALALSFSSVVTAQDADEPATAATPAPEAPDAMAEAMAPTAAASVAPPASLASQAASSVVQAATAVAHTFQGIVSYYGREFAGRKTANGERFDPAVLTMAHKTLAFGTLVRVTNLQNNRSVVVRVNDRGPFVGSRVGDLSAGAARLLDMLGAGVVQARLEVLGAALSQAFR